MTPSPPINTPPAPPTVEGEGNNAPAEVPFRARWLPLLGMLVGFSFVGMLLIQRIGTPPPSVPPPPPTVTSLSFVELPTLGVSLLAPDNWQPPALRSETSFVLSPDGATDTSTTAGPFLYVVVDALDVFSQQLTLRTDYGEPAAQLDALIDALNRDRARFTAAKPYPNVAGTAAFVEGIERGNELRIVLIKTESGRWLYVGAQATQAQFPYYDVTVFTPATKALRLTK